MKLLLSVFAAVLVSTSFGQQPDFGGKAQKEGLAKLSFMLGEWKGSGWAEYQGRKSEFQGTETILPKCDGVIFSLEGNHTTTRDGRTIPVHQAFGTLRFDEKAKKYFMRAHLASGLEMEYEFTGLPTGYKWEQDSPSWGHVVYTAEFTGDSWLEYGEVEKDGKKTRVYEMKMTRMKGVAK